MTEDMTTSSDVTTAAELAGVPGESVYVETNGVRLHTIQAGPEHGPLVVLLHGFPEFWYCWHDQIRPLADAGFRVVVPDQRGYNLSDKPDDVNAYHMDELAADIVGLIDAAGRGKASVVGHDWGAAVAWWVALHYPDRVEKLCAVNVPHPTVMRRAIRNRWDQRFRSWYFAFFQIPAVPEAFMRFHNWGAVVRTMERSSQPGTFSPTDFERYRQAWRQPGAFSAMIDWYRAVVRQRPSPRTDRVTVPTLVIWGAQDDFIEKRTAWESVEFCDDGRVAMLPDATHWVQHDEPIRVGEILLDFLRE